MYNKNENPNSINIIGRNPVLEALKSGRQIDKIFVKKGDINGSLTKIIAVAQDKKIPVSYAEKTKLDMMCEGQNHQGVVALVPAKDYVSVDDILQRAKEKGTHNFIIIADEITDPHNLGAILRTANSAGADGVIISKHRSVGLTSAAAKTSAGAVEYTPVAKVANIAQTIEKLKKNNIWVIGADMDGENTIYTQDFSGNVAIVIGSEGNGISKIVKEKCDFLVKIPMFGEVTSLNASVAGALMIYEVVRERIDK